MRIIINIQNTSGQPAKVFNARASFGVPNFGNPPTVSISIVVGPDYVLKYGAVPNYSTFLADCFKYSFFITAINGTAVTKDPFKDEFDTSATQLQVDLQEPYNGFSYPQKQL